MYDETDSDNDSMYSDDSTTTEYDSLDKIYKYDYTILKYKQNKKYYIGLVALIDSVYLLAHSVTPKSLFKYSYNTVLIYLYNYSIIDVKHPKIDIFQLYITENNYTVIVKTHWIRLIQRHWKKVYKTRTDILRKRALSCNHYPQSVFNKYLNNEIPGLRCMLSHYALLNVNKYKN
jgi:predicted nucleic-acid-binding protein